MESRGSDFYNANQLENDQAKRRVIPNLPPRPQATFTHQIDNQTNPANALDTSFQRRLSILQRPNPTRQDCCLVQFKEFNRNINSLAKWIEGAIQRFRSGVKNSRVIEVHNTCHYMLIVDEALVVRETRKFLLDE